jgi:chitinase
VDKHFQTTEVTDATDTTKNVAGNVWQIWCLKKKNRHLKTMVSIGGWRLSENWSEACSTPARRQKFVETCMHCMYNFGWDGKVRNRLLKAAITDNFLRN